MKILPSWLAPLKVAVCSLVFYLPARADDVKAPPVIQSLALTLEPPPLEEMEPTDKNTHEITGIPRGLIGWWTGDADALDSLGQNNGRVHGHVTYVSGTVGQAFHLDGEKSYIKVSTTDLDPGTGAGFTLDTWIKADDLSKLQPVAGWSGVDTPGVSLWIEPATEGGKAKFGTDLRDMKGGSHRLLSRQAVIVAGKWQHILLEYRRDTGVVGLFCNGQVQAQKNVGELDPRTNLDFFIGKHIYINGGNTTFKGDIDEVSLTARALNPTEIRGVFRAGSAGKQLVSDKDTTLTEEQRRVSIEKRLASFVAKHKGQAMSFAIYVDGSDSVHIQGGKLWFVHGGWDLPGGNGLHPTRINGKEWLPTWNDKTSDKYTLTTPLPQDSESVLSLDILNNGEIPAQSDAPFNVRVTQQPTAANNYEAVLYLDDFNVPGAHWFVFSLSWAEKSDF
ncbi:hypothetical protein IAD21_01017 [Abditibacteriota bacterium]|nr:hypothetical protein IAD21_01017 [Abditibacteriota bacterium]